MKFNPNTVQNLVRVFKMRSLGFEPNHQITKKSVPLRFILHSK